MTKRWLAIIVLVGSAITCGDEGVTLVDDYPVIRIFGFVRADGNPVPGAEVVMRTAVLLNCADATPEFLRRTTTDASGHYEMPMTYIGPERYTGCFETTVTPPQAAGLPPLVRAEDVDFLVARQGTEFRFDVVYPD